MSGKTDYGSDGIACYILEKEEPEVIVNRAVGKGGAGLLSRPGSCLPSPSRNRTSSFPAYGSSFGLRGFVFMLETDIGSS